MFLVACSQKGVHGADRIGESIAMGNYHAAFLIIALTASIIVCVSRARRTWIWPVLLMGFLSLHPAWTISAIRGDCGAIRVAASWAVSAIACGLLVGQAVQMLGTAAVAEEIRRRLRG